VKTIPASGTASVIPTSRNYYDNLQKQPAEEDERQSLGQASASSDVFPKVTVKQPLAGMTRPLETISEVTVKENTTEEPDKTKPRTSMQAPSASPAQSPIDFIRKTIALAAQENIRQSGMSIR
jgi:hypothetical protein